MTGLLILGNINPRRLSPGCFEYYYNKFWDGMLGIDYSEDSLRIIFVKSKCWKKVIYEEKHNATIDRLVKFSETTN